MRWGEQAITGGSYLLRTVPEPADPGSATCHAVDFSIGGSVPARRSRIREGGS